MSNFTIQVSGDIIIYNGVEYTLKGELIDPEYVSSLEQQVAFLTDENERLEHIISDAGVTTNSALDTAQQLSSDLEELKQIIKKESIPNDTTVIIDPDASFSINNVLDEIRNEEDGKHETILIRSGIYHEQIDLSGVKNITLKAHPDNEGPVVISGFRKAEWVWTSIGENSYTGDWPGYADLWQQVDTGSAYNQKMAYPVLACIGDEPLMWDVDFQITSDADKPGTIAVHLKEGQDIKDFRFSPFPWLLKGDNDCDGITLKGIDFEGCSNTNFTGAVSLPGKNWHIEDVEVRLVNTIGIELGQGGYRENMRGQLLDSTLINVTAKDCGMMGWWGAALRCHLETCGHVNSNWKKFDFAWHASHKFENMHHCTLNGWFALNCYGTGLWFDGVTKYNPITGKDEGGNTHNTILNVAIENCVRVGVEIELGTSNNAIEGVQINGVRKLQSPDLEKSAWAIHQSAGVVIKGGSDRNTIKNITVKDADKAIWIDNEDSRGLSRDNIITGLYYEDIEEELMYLPKGGDMMGNTVSRA